MDRLPTYETRLCSQLAGALLREMDQCTTIAELRQCVMRCADPRGREVQLHVVVTREVNDFMDVFQTCETTMESCQDERHSAKKSLIP